ncbi:MAG: hypothetical protein ACYC27_09860 [Armatimonadota bacterium]
MSNFMKGRWDDKARGRTPGVVASVPESNRRADVGAEAGHVDTDPLTLALSRKRARELSEGLPAAEVRMQHNKK